MTRLTSVTRTAENGASPKTESWTPGVFKSFDRALPSPVSVSAFFALVCAAFVRCPRSDAPIRPDPRAIGLLLSNGNSFDVGRTSDSRFINV